MGKNKRKLPATSSGKGRHWRENRSRDGSFAPPRCSALVATKPLPKPKDKHHTYLEFVENKDKKIKLNTFSKIPPRGYDFVAAGHPSLTSTCKEMSRESGAKMFIVANTNELDPHSFANQVNRVGYHFDSRIVERAKAIHMDSPIHLPVDPNARPEPIPYSQREYHAQADAVLRDLFPRIPHTDRQMIIDHSFTRVRPHGINIKPQPAAAADLPLSQRSSYRGKLPVGLSADVPLARRAQLAVLAHIRHCHTRYDELLRDVGWDESRKTIQAACLDVLVKWRGDEETGRDQLEEILREVVVISDSEDDDFDDENPPDASVADSTRPLDSRVDVVNVSDRASSRLLSTGTTRELHMLSITRGSDEARPGRAQRRGFKRYAAVQQAWSEAVERSRATDASAGHIRQVTHVPFDEPIAGAVNADQGHRTPISFGLPGGAPSSNGYVPQSRRRNTPLPGALATFAEVNLVTRGQPGRGPASASYLNQTHHLETPVEDMLVRSIESAPPETSRPPAVSDMYASSSRYHPVGMPQTLEPRDASHFDYGHHVGYAAVPGWSRAATSEYGTGSSTVHSAPDRIVANAAPPGSRSNPILMEDRAGFYERVADPYTPSIMNDRLNETLRPGRQVTGLPAHHRVVSSEEGSSTLRASLDTPGFETVPISRSGNPSRVSHSLVAPIHQSSLNSWEPARPAITETSSYLGGGHNPGHRPTFGQYPPPPSQLHQAE
ncbi:hypothetical protein DCS_02892 [Drechmeria coniospora]|uniref:DUF2293 domain-containing protein n=1 Tax=Drechmeria coniospora TaxID=98403 RepID=A0A151GXB8_DRECN|nr:hypothetical protein DCS_02892 [Drechmeria coniospora]KYK61749.1 hypothetical protein DCS_02892 [Drechmeria coniospora]